MRDGSCDMVSFHLPVAVAGLLGQQGQVFEARTILEQVVKERVDVLGLHDEGTLVAKEALAVFLHDQVSSSTLIAEGCMRMHDPPLPSLSPPAPRCSCATRRYRRRAHQHHGVLA